MFVVDQHQDLFAAVGSPAGSIALYQLVDPLTRHPELRIGLGGGQSLINHRANNNQIL